MELTITQQELTTTTNTLHKLTELGVITTEQTLMVLRNIEDLDV